MVICGCNQTYYKYQNWEDHECEYKDYRILTETKFICNFNIGYDKYYSNFIWCSKKFIDLKDYI